MTRKIISAAALLISANLAMAQGIAISGQNYMNRFSLAPAFAGFNGNHEGFLGYRTTMTGIDGAPKILHASASGFLGENMGYGVHIVNEKSGNFSNTFAAISYAYHIPFSTDMGLSFALSPAIVRSAFDIASAKTYSANTDPVFQNEAGLSGTGFDAGFSMVFNAKNLLFSVYAPRLICQDLKFQNGIIDSERTINSALSYTIEHDQWEFEPMVQVDYGMETGIAWQALAAIKYNRKAWLQMSYSSEKWIGIGAGFTASNKIALCYQYEIGTSDIAKTCNGNHEITVGFLIGKRGNYKIPSVFGEEDSHSPKRDSDIERKFQGEIERLEDLINKVEEKSGAFIDNPTDDDNHTNPAEPTHEDISNDIQVTDNTQPDNTLPDNNKPNITNSANAWKDPLVLNIDFNYGTSIISEKSYSEIRIIASMMKKNPKKKVMIASYTDNQVPKAYARKLTEQRARAVRDYLVNDCGADPSRVEYVGEGSKKIPLTTDPMQIYEYNNITIYWKYIKDEDYIKAIQNQNNNN